MQVSTQETLQTKLTNHSVKLSRADTQKQDDISCPQQNLTSNGNGIGDNDEEDYDDDHNDGDYNYDGTFQQSYNITHSKVCIRK